MTFLGLVVGALLGVGLYARWMRQKASASLRVPSKWPLAPRVLITAEEQEVLDWLLSTFHDHLVMVKLPVLRFTAPTGRAKKGGTPAWQELLGGVYCSFTVCTSDGSVVGCVDVPGKRGLNKANRDLKESLLSDCRIAYTVVRSGHFPKVSAMRAAFLGELEAEDQLEHQPTRGGDSSFHADLDSFTRQRRLAAQEAALKVLNARDEPRPSAKSQPLGFNADGTGATGGEESRRFPRQWEDSFIPPDESRPAKLG
jgi:hypothetical protein